MLDPLNMGTLQYGFLGSVVKPPGAKTPQFITVFVEYPADRPVFNVVALILKPPTKIHVFAHHHILPETSYL